ncbi:MAG TPA: hypothetical protein VMJ14_16125 [Burkholderiales bacterium]|nr:hypothetical protein [Burkholderiales bacterium]
MNPMLFIAIEFSNGTKVKYSFPMQSANQAARQMKLEDFLKGRHLVIQAEGRLMIYPMEHIKAIEMSAGGGTLDGVKLPLHTIRDAKLQER